jgi:hypothetical protein
MCFLKPRYHAWRRRPAWSSSNNRLYGDAIAMNAPVKRTLNDRAGKIKYGILAWMLGLPLPIVILALFFRGCDF